MSMLTSRPIEDRASVALPSIKCSSCSAPIPLSSIGEHVCAGPAQSSSSSSALRAGFARPQQAGPSGSSRQHHPARPAQLVIPPTSSRIVPQIANAPRSAGPEPSPSFRPPFVHSSSSSSRGASPASLKIPVHLPSTGSLSPHGRVSPSPAFGPPAPAFAGPSPTSSSPTNPFFPHVQPGSSPAKGVMVHGLGLGVGAMGDEISRTQSPYPTDAPLPAGVQDPMTSSAPVGGNSGMAGVGRRAFAAAAWGVRAGVALASGPTRPTGPESRDPLRPPAAPGLRSGSLPRTAGTPPQQYSGSPMSPPQLPQAPFTRSAPASALSPPAPPFQRSTSASSPTGREGPVLPRVPLSGRPPNGGAGPIGARSVQGSASSAHKPSAHRQDSAEGQPAYTSRPPVAHNTPKSPPTMTRKDSVASVSSSISRSSSTNGDSIAQLLKARAQVERTASEKSTKPFFDRYKAMAGRSSSSGASQADGTASPMLGFGSRRASEDAIKTAPSASRSEDYDDDLGSALPWASREIVDEPEERTSFGRAHQRHDTSESESSASTSRSQRHMLSRSGENEVVITPSQSLEGLADRVSTPSDRQTSLGRGEMPQRSGSGMDAYAERESLEQIGEESEEDEGGRVAFGRLQDRLKNGAHGNTSFVNANRSPAGTRPGLGMSGRGVDRSYTAPAAPDMQRSNSSSTSGTHVTLQSSTTTSSRRSKICVKCGEIVGGTKRFVERDGVVLCEKDWKKMYLPSCRQCKLPIEKSAVSSSDGQLKGKWHRECFGCTRCGEAFVEDSFYVLDGKPWCQYHYHEENGTLCASNSCRRPIEGPCIIAPNSERYHPGHLRCAHQAGSSGVPTCHDRMEEYYEIGGKRYCEQHAHAASTGTSGRAGSNSLGAGLGGLRAEKRRTRLVDLPRGMVGT